jgi:hypothetical protein
MRPEHENRGSGSGLGRVSSAAERDQGQRRDQGDDQKRSFYRHVGLSFACGQAIPNGSSTGARALFLEPETPNPEPTARADAVPCRDRDKAEQALINPSGIGSGNGMSGIGLTGSGMNIANFPD